MSDPKEPAFPRSYVADGHNGMTLRDWFAGQAMIGICANPEEAKGSRGLSLDKTVKITAQAAYLIADAMLAERSK